MVDKTIFRWREAGSTPAWCAKMKHTLARREFKRHLGQANHFLVTTLVALDCLSANQKFEALGLHAAWSPKSVPHSVQRSRIFVLHAFLGSAVDALDVYFSLMNRKPDFLQDDEFSSKLQACERSVYKKAMSFSEWVPNSRLEAALVECLITWRNNVMHELGDNELSERSKATLLECSAVLSINYRSLDASNLAQKVESGSDLTFKETASLISAAHKFVEKADCHALKNLDKARFYAAALRDTLKNSPANQGFRTRLFDSDSERWSGFISNWAGNALHSPPLPREELDVIRGIIPGLKGAVG